MNHGKRISDYAVIGDLSSGALVRRDCAIEWACLPRFDAEPCLSALLGDDDNGMWSLRPVQADATFTRRYLNDTLVLETIVTTADGQARIVDFMPVGSDLRGVVVRIVEGMHGSVRFESQLAPRMKYGLLRPWSRIENGAWVARLAPDGLCLRANVELDDTNAATHSTFTVSRNKIVWFTLQWFNAAKPVPQAIDAYEQLQATQTWWRAWVAQSNYVGVYRDSVIRSAITLKALSSIDYGSFVAALTTSLPEKRGGDLNWDYRYTWLRDASFTIDALLRIGFCGESAAWRDWFLRTCPGQPEHLHIMYGIGGERLDLERSIDWLTGFQGSKPVRIANGAHDQFQLGVYGDVLHAFDHASRLGVPFNSEHRDLIGPLLDFLEARWQTPDSGIWESRDGLHQHVSAKAMTWIAFDRALKIFEREELPIDRAHWRALMARIHEETCAKGFNREHNTFTQSYDSTKPDASLLLLLLHGFLPPDDPRMLGTIAAVEKYLLIDGYVYRYEAEGMPTPELEGSFTMCGFWLVQAYVMTGRHDDARVLFDRLAATANDVGLFSEEFDPVEGIALGNFPQAFSHVGYIHAAAALDGIPVKNA